MELDEMKNIWKKMDTLSEKVTIANNTILEMLKNSYNGSMTKLIKTEKNKIKLLPFLSLFIYFIFSNLPASWEFIPVLKWVLISMCLINFFWSFYKCLFLKKIDIVRMNIADVFERITTYKKYIVLQQKIGIAFFILFSGLYFYFQYKQTSYSITFYLTLFISELILLFYLYKQLYFNNIKRVQESLAEIEDFREKETEA